MHEAFYGPSSDTVVVPHGALALATATDPRTALLSLVPPRWQSVALVLEATVAGEEVEGRQKDVIDNGDEVCHPVAQAIREEARKTHGERHGLFTR